MKRQVARSFWQMSRGQSLRVRSSAAWREQGEGKSDSNMACLGTKEEDGLGREWLGWVGWLVVVDYVKGRFEVGCYGKLWIA